ncbi:uncharacterized protein B0H64DRAFT_135065 [Chaetomium fimeti]|uniref:Uncharacterized protein n=1 Tax=Chaetomium fimeti TaxID=1854472 RepID=A0AAE0HK06_9PEZI|nr:hypothetical protein B0H64DRAFT_135065 [Chaetomium fimeti]
MHGTSGPRLWCGQNPVFALLLPPRFRWGWVALHLAAACSLQMLQLPSSSMCWWCTNCVSMAREALGGGFLCSRLSCAHAPRACEPCGCPCSEACAFQMEIIDFGSAWAWRFAWRPPRDENPSVCWAFRCCMLPRRDQQGRDERFC